MVERKVDAISSGGTGSPPLVETNPPFLQNQNPSPGQINVILNPVILFRITDNPDDLHSGVDISTLVIQVQVGAGPLVEAYNAFTGGFHNGFTGSVIDVFLNQFSYDVTVDPPGIYAGLTAITVYVQVRDKQTLVVNQLATSYSFTTRAAEASAPFLNNQSPAPGSGPVGNLLNTNIDFRVNDTATDPNSGVKIDTLRVRIRRGAAQPFEDAIIAGVFQLGFTGTITPVGGTNTEGIYYFQYNVVIDPATDLFDADTTSVRVEVDDTKPTPNHLDTTYSFQIEQADQTPPYVNNQDPEPSESNVAGDTDIYIEIHDDDVGVDQNSIDIVVSIDGTPSNAVLNGVIQPGWLGGSFFSFLPDGYSYTLVPDIEIGTSHEVTVQVDAQDAAVSPNVMSTVSYQFFSSFVQPTARIAQQRYDAVLGSIIQLDARKSTVPDHSPLSWEWRFVQVPIGSGLFPDVGVVNPASMTDLRPDLRSAVSFIPDKLGLYLVELVVKNGGTGSDPVTAEVHVGLTRQYHGEPHSPPDVHFLWNFISNFWNLVEDRQYIEVLWSAVVQAIGSEYIKLWSNDFNKSLATIQKSVQRHWVKFDATTSLIDRVQRVILGNEDSGTMGATGSMVDPGSGLTKSFHIPLGDVENADYGDFTRLAVNYGAKGRIIDINGTGYTLERAFNTTGEVPASLLKAWKLISLVYTDITAAVDSTTTNVAIFEGSNHYVVLTYSSKFGRIRVALQSPASVDLAPTFEYSTEAGWTLFSPTTDGTTGFTLDGDITFDPASLVGWVSRTENGVAGFHIRIKRTTLVATAPVEKSIFVVSAHSFAIVDEEALTAGMVGLPWRVPHLLHVPLVDLEDAGVRKGDTLVFEVRRQDTGLTAELHAQVVTVDRERAGFEFNLAALSPGDATIDHALFRQLVVDLRIVHPSALVDEVAAAAEALLAFMPTGINLSTRPFSEFQIIFTAKKIIHNTAIKVDSRVISVPHLQQEIKTDPNFILQENWDYVLNAGYLEFVSDLFTTGEPAPETLWAEIIHVDNTEVIEGNFGRLVGLTNDALVAKATRAPYLAAVRGLWYAFTRGPTVDAVRLGIQILMGLPFTDERGEVIAITENFTVDSFGKPLGRLLVEDVDEHDRRLGIRKIYYYPMAIGLETNPRTGAPYKIGDIVERFIPLSKGVIVTDYVREPRWWVRSLHGLEVMKFFIFRAQVDVETGVFDHRDLHFALEFVRAIKPVYTQIIASALRSLEDNVMDTFSDEMKGTIKLAFYDNVGAWGGLESTYRSDDDNHQGFTLWRSNSRPFSTRSAHLLRDVITTNGGTVVANSVTGFGFVRARIVGDGTHPTLEGDILAIIQNQPGADMYAPGLYEVTSVVNPNQVVLGNLSTPYDPTTLLISAPPFATFPIGTNLKATVVRRDRNPVVHGTDLVTTAVDNLVTSAGASFLLDNVSIDDHLIIEAGANKGEYRITHVNVLTTPRAYTPAGEPHIDATQVKLVHLDGTIPTFSALSSQDFRVIRPAMMANRLENAQVVQSGGQMFVQVLDAADGSKPFDVFTPGLIGTNLRVANASNPANDGEWEVLEYIHAGKLRLNMALHASDGNAQAIVTLKSPYHPGFEKASELAPFEVFIVEFLDLLEGIAAGTSTVTGSLGIQGLAAGTGAASLNDAGGLSAGTSTASLYGNYGSASGTSSASLEDAYGEADGTCTVDGTAADLEGQSDGTSTVEGDLTS